MQIQHIPLLAAAAALSLASGAFAQNDECTGAISVTQGLNGPFSTVGSTTSAPAWPCAAGGNDIWFVYVAPGAGSLTVNTCTGTTYDSAIEVFDGNGGCNALVSLGCNDDSCGLQSSLTVTVNTADTIYIRVGGFASGTGTFQLDVNGPTGGGGVATATNYGAGCYDRPQAYYEAFATGTLDLAGTSTAPLTYLHAPTGNGGYVLLPGSGAWFTPVSSSIPLGDDTVSGPQTLPFPFPYPGGTTNDLWIGSNGMIFPTSTTTTDYTPSVGEFLGQMPRYCPLWRDMNPTSGGAVYFDVDPSNAIVYVTFDAVPNFGQTANTNTFQVAFFNSGLVEYRFQDCNATSATTSPTTIVGYSAGAVNGDPGNIDISVQFTQGYLMGNGQRPLTLRASGRPRTGTTIQLALSNVPGATDLGAVLVNFAAVIPGIDLASFGMPGCTQHIALAGAPTLGFMIGNGQVPFSVPAGPRWIGTSVFVQGACFSPGVNPLGALSSNGVHLVVGNL